MSDKFFNYKGYCGSLEVSVDDDCLFGKVLFINDLVTYEGQSPAELKAAFEESLDYYLDKCERDGVNPEKPFSGSFNIRISPELHREAAMRAAMSGQSLNDYVRQAIEVFGKTSRQKPQVKLKRATG